MLGHLDFFPVNDLSTDSNNSLLHLFGQMDTLLQNVSILGVQRIESNPEVVVQASVQVVQVSVLENLFLELGDLFVFRIYIFLISVVGLCLVGLCLALFEGTGLFIVVSVDVVWVIQQAGNGVSLIGR
jgi:hypothetical protein